MNTFNRVVLVILLLVAMALCSLVSIMPVQALRVVAQQAEQLAALLTRVTFGARLAFGVLLTVIVLLVGVLFIFLEVRKPAARSIDVEKAAGGKVTLSIASIADQLKAEVNQLPEVLQAKPKVSAKRKGVVVELDAKIAADAGVPGKAERIVETIRRVIEEKMGLKLAQPPQVNIEAVRQAPGIGTRVASVPSPEEEEMSGTEDVSS